MLWNALHPHPNPKADYGWGLGLIPDKLNVLALHTVNVEIAPRLSYWMVAVAVLGVLEEPPLS